MVSQQLSPAALSACPICGMSINGARSMHSGAFGIFDIGVMVADLRSVSLRVDLLTPAGVSVVIAVMNTDHPNPVSQFYRGWCFIAVAFAAASAFCLLSSRRRTPTEYTGRALGNMRVERRASPRPPLERET